MTKLSKARIDELRELLQRTTLASVITASRKVGDRLDFINGLNALLFGMCFWTTAVTRSETSSSDGGCKPERTSFTSWLSN